MYYKVLKDNKVIDVLDHLTFVKYQEKHGVMLLSDKLDAQGIVSSDEKFIWHVAGMKEIPVNGYDTVKLVGIDKYEYSQLKVLNMKTPEEIIDEYTLLLISGGVL